MDTREIAKEYRLSHWTGIMQERKESGQSIKTYCETVGIHPNVYYYWQRKLREAACQELLPPKQETDQIAMIPSGWAVCEPESSPSRSSGTVIIEIGKGRIVATPDTDSELLAKVCRILVSLC